jgi:hypothetical protein
MAAALLEASVRGACRQAAFHFVARNSELLESLQLDVQDKSEEAQTTAVRSRSRGMIFAWPSRGWTPFSWGINVEINR